MPYASDWRRVGIFFDFRHTGGTQSRSPRIRYNFKWVYGTGRLCVMHHATALQTAAQLTLLFCSDWISKSCSEPAICARLGQGRAGSKRSRSRYVLSMSRSERARGKKPENAIEI